MKKSSLDPVFKFRDQKVKMLQGELASLVRYEENLKEKENALARETDELDRLMHEMRCKGNLKEQHESLSYSIQLHHQLIKIHEQLASQRKTIFSKQQDLSQALKERKIIEKLKEKQYSSWLQKIANAED